MYGSEVSFRCCSSDASHLVFLKQGLSLAWDLLIRLCGWPKGSACLHFASPVIKSMCRHARLFMWVLGIKLGSLCLHGKHFAD